ncbi:hypothetical protein B0H19DRAFT_1110871 [Mycena capillaripes]|nr:hypothetical protein B0H19DRAFT_1110871 [Mycena capillaripes]
MTRTPPTNGVARTPPRRTSPLIKSLRIIMSWHIRWHPLCLPHDRRLVRRPRLQSATLPRRARGASSTWPPSRAM